MNSTFWASVGYVVSPADELRMLHELDAAGTLGDTVDGHVQGCDKWIAAARGKRPGLPAGLSRAARLRLWRSSVMRANHRRVVELAALHFERTLLEEFDVGSSEEKYLEFLHEWILGLRQALREFAWSGVPKGEVRRYLFGAAVREARRALRRAYVRRAVDPEVFEVVGDVAPSPPRRRGDT